ncbi:GntR family transcriptional regulator [Cryobacterium sp. TMT3-29-2]|uniref:GntR family transcriptional regulator n=1 Tax=Cryobacterium sp. TMT3-29-2 TaxID=2555867 RepID=UPI0010738AE7|nr:GntR family transcriptional regulator [Cryobacterium sp. TMT3-29-2]TFC88156.1 GntR family transcriptional regulator [Cryobacterium sp. TMT3-29-2]
MIFIDNESPIPVFEQIRVQIETQIIGGKLGPQQRLPTVRQLASDLGIAPGTVSRAYAELESVGLIETHGRRGSRVADNIEDRSEVLDAALDYSLVARKSGLTLAQAILALRASWDA